MSRTDSREDHWYARSESLKSVQSDRSTGRRNSAGRRSSRNGHVHGSYRPMSKLPTLQSPSSNRSSRLQNGRYPVIPPLSAEKKPDRQPKNGSVGKSSWTKPPLENSNDGRIPRPERLTANVPRVIDNANYRNYLKKRFPRIAAVQEEIHRVTSPSVTLAPSPVQEPSKPPARWRTKKTRPPPPPAKQEIVKKKETETFTYFSEHSFFAAQYTEDLIMRFLEEELIADVIVDSVQESFSEKMFHSNSDLFSFWNDNPGFASDFVDSIMDRVIEDEIVPDLLIDVIADSRPNDKQIRSAVAVDVYQNLVKVVVSEEAQAISTEIRHQTRTIMERDFQQMRTQQTQYAEVYISALMNDYIVNASRLIVREVVIETATEEMYNAIYFDVMHSVFVECMREDGPNLVLAAYAEATAEVFFEQEVLNAVLSQEMEVVATEVLTYYDTQHRRKNLQEIMNLGKEKPVATIALDHCLSLITGQQTAMSANEVLHKTLEGLCLDALLDASGDLVNNYRFTTDDEALKRFHEKATLDVAVDVLAKELIDHADEDLADLDFEEIDKDHIPRYVRDIDPIFYGDVNTGSV